MAARLRDALNGGEARRDEVGDILEGFALDDDEQVEAAAHEVDGADLIEAVDAFCNGVEADLALRRQVDLDDGRHSVRAELLPVDQRVVGQDDLVLLQLLDILLDFVLAAVQHRGQLVDRTARVVLEELQQFFHVKSPLLSGT